MLILRLIIILVFMALGGVMLVITPQIGQLVGVPLGLAWFLLSLFVFIAGALLNFVTLPYRDTSFDSLRL